MNNFIVGEVTPTMLQHLGFGTFVFFGAFSLLGGLFIMFFVRSSKYVPAEYLVLKLVSRFLRPKE